MTIAFTLPGQVPIYMFSLLVGAAASLGLYWAAQQTKTRQAQARLSAGLFSLLLAFAGGRGGFILLNWSYFSAHRTAMVQPPWGGMVWSGALAGFLLGIFIAALFQKASFFFLLDIYFPLIVAVGLAAWLGCWLDGCAFGPPSAAWYAVPASDDWGNLTRRFPTQLLGAFTGLVTLALHDRLRNWIQNPGLSGTAGLAILSLQTLWLTGLRADPLPAFNTVRVDLLSAWSFFGVSALLFALALVRKGQKSKNTSHLLPKAD